MSPRRRTPRPREHQHLAQPDQPPDFFRYLSQQVLICASASLILCMQKNPVQYTPANLWQCLDTRHARKSQIRSGLYDSSFLLQLFRTRPAGELSNSQSRWNWQNTRVSTLFFPLPQAGTVLFYTQSQIPGTLQDLPSLLPDYCSHIHLPCSSMLQTLSTRLYSSAQVYMFLI